MKNKLYLLTLLSLFFSCSKLNRSPGEANNLSLNSLSFSKNNINYLSNFDSLNKNYLFSVPEAVSSIIINAGSGQSKASIEVSNNKNQTVCEAKQNIKDCQMPLVLDENVITIKLTTQDYQTTYKVVITRNIEIPSVLAKDIDIYGSGFKVYNYIFNKNVFNYAITIDTDESELSFVVYPESASTTTIRINNVVKTCTYSSPCKIEVLQDQIIVKIKLENAYTNKLYAFTLSKDTSAYLNDLKVLDNGTNRLNGFNSQIFTYNNILLSPSSESIVLSINKKYGSSISLYKNSVFLNVSGVINGNFIDYNISVPEIYPSLKIHVETSSTSANYNLNINKSTPYAISSVSYLLNQNTGNFEYNAELFTFHKTFTNAQVSGINQITLTATSIFSGAKVSINDYIFGNSPRTKTINISSINGLNGGVLGSNFIIVKQSINSPEQIEYSLVIEVLPTASNDNVQLASLTIKDIEDNLISLKPSFYHNVYNYEAMIDPLKNKIKVSAVSINSNASINISYGATTCTGTGSVTNCTISGVSDSNDLHIIVSNNTTSKDYFVSFKEGYLIYENNLASMGGNPGVHDMFGEYLASTQITIGNTKYNYMLIANPRENTVYVYRASVDQNGVYTNYALLETLNVNYSNGTNPYKFTNPIVPYISNVFSLNHISGFGASIAISDEFILIGAPGTSINGNSNSGCVLSYKIDKTTGSIMAHQLILPSQGDSLNNLYGGYENYSKYFLEFGHKLSIDKNSDHVLISDNINIDSSRKSLYVFFNTGIGDKPWILGSNFQNKKFVKIETDYGINTAISNVSTSETTLGVCFTYESVKGICWLYMYNSVDKTYDVKGYYDDLNYLGTSMELLETTQYSALFFSSKQNSNGELNYLLYNKANDQTYENTLDTGDYQSERLAHSFSLISKTIGSTLRRFLVIGSPYDGTEQGVFSLYELTSFSGVKLDYQIIANDISIATEYKYEDDRIAYNMSVTEDFVIVSAPYYDTGANQSENQGAVIIFRADLIFPKSSGINPAVID